MEWLYLKNSEELKNYANRKYNKNPFNKLRKEIAEDLKSYINNIDKKVKLNGELIVITANSWSKLFEKIYLFREMTYKLGGNNKAEEVLGKVDKDITKEVTNKDLDNDTYESEYFKSKNDELIFYILELSGKKRNEKLGVKDIYYKDKVAAEKWRRNILLKIHPDLSKNPKASEALIKFEQLCELIVK